MKKKIAILGSTGSIGKSLVEIIRKDKKNFDVLLLTANKNHKTLLKQAKILKVKNIIVSNQKSYNLIKKKASRLNIKVFKDYNELKEIFKEKIYYTMSAISGLEGLDPTLRIIKYTKRIAIANKESIICGWNLIKKKLTKHKTDFIPVDSEHFSIWYAMSKNEIKNIDEIYITASGGPLLNYPLKNFKNIKIKKALSHPNWNMGKKISIDSATMMNKVFEVIEAGKIFNIPPKKIKILIEPSSYIHAIIKFNNGMIKLIAHETTMKIPIFNTLYNNHSKKLLSKKINVVNLNNLSFKNVDFKRFPVVKIINSFKKKDSLFETTIVTANDVLVDLYLNKKINFKQISEILLKVSKKKDFLKYMKIKPNSFRSIEKISKYVRLKILSMSV